MKPKGGNWPIAIAVIIVFVGVVAVGVWSTKTNAPGTHPANVALPAPTTTSSTLKAPAALTPTTAAQAGDGGYGDGALPPTVTPTPHTVTSSPVTVTQTTAGEPQIAPQSFVDPYVPLPVAVPLPEPSPVIQGTTTTTQAGAPRGPDPGRPVVTTTTQKPAPAPTTTTTTGVPPTTTTTTVAPPAPYLVVTTSYDGGAMGGEPIGFDAFNFPPDQTFAYFIVDNNTMAGYLSPACDGNLTTDVNGDASVTNACGVTTSANENVTVTYDGVSITSPAPFQPGP